MTPGRCPLSIFCSRGTPPNQPSTLAGPRYSIRTTTPPDRTASPSSPVQAVRGGIGGTISQPLTAHVLVGLRPAAVQDCSAYEVPLYM